jgi:hypothetical protein
LTDKQLSTLRHMLGLTDLFRAQPVPYRNYAAVNPGDPEYLELERLGMIELRRRNGPDNPYDNYACTEEGRRLATTDFMRVRKSRKKAHV